MKNIFNKNAGYKKMKYIKSKYILISLKEKKIQKELLLKKIKTIIQSLIIFAFINFIIYLLIKNALKLSKQYIKIKIYPDNNNTYAYYYYKNLSLNYTTQNYSIKDIEPDELKKYLDYMDKARLGIFLNKQNLKKIKNPKISIVISLYNRERYVNSTIRSVQNQNLSEIEIIIIDDFSTDNSTKYIKELQKKDPRILLFKNKKNMGTLYSKSIGVLNAKGKYIYSLDSDDMLCNEHYFSNLYDEAITGDYDFIQCSAIYLDEVRKVIYKRSPNWVVLWSKLISTKAYQKAIYKLGKEVLNNKVIVLDDDIIALYLFVTISQKKSSKIGVCHFIHFDGHVYFNQFMSVENFRRFCTNMITTIDTFYKMKKYFYGDFLLKYLFIGGGSCKRVSNLTEAQNIIQDFIRRNSTKKSN